MIPTHVFVRSRRMSVLALLLVAAPAWSQQVTVFAAGDIMLSRGVARVMATQGYAFPYVAMVAAMRGADVSFANLECALTTGPAHQHGTQLWNQGIGVQCVGRDLGTGRRCANRVPRV